VTSVVDAPVDLRRQGRIHRHNGFRLPRHVDESRRHRHAPRGAFQSLYGGDPAGANGDIARTPRRAGTVNLNPAVQPPQRPEPGCVFNNFQLLRSSSSG